MRMTFEEFRNTLLDHREEFLPYEYRNAELSIEHVDKLNHSYDALQIRMPGSPYAAAMDLDQFYERNKHIPSADVYSSLRDVIGTLELERGKELSSAGEWLSDYGNVKGSLFVRCSNAEKNEELLKETPHTQIGDLTFTVHVGLNWKEETDPVYSTIVTNPMLENWGISSRTLIADAVENAAKRMPVVCRPLNDIMGDIMDMDPADMEAPDSGLFVLTNSNAQYGAAAIIYPGVLEGMQKRLGNFYMLPSSVHEFLLLPESMDVSVRDLERMVQDVNRSVLAEGDFLSDRVYHYDGAIKRMEPAWDYLERKEQEKHMSAGTGSINQGSPAEGPDRKTAVHLAM